jgi:hypothetical protein
MDDYTGLGDAEEWEGDHCLVRILWPHNRRITVPRSAVVPIDDFIAQEIAARRDLPGEIKLKHWHRIPKADSYPVSG